MDDPTDDRWHQTWVGAGGSILTLSGSFANNVMDLQGISHGRNGGDLLKRNRWFDQPDGSVRQWWQAWRDGGDTWTTAFDGTYVKRP